MARMFCLTVCVIALAAFDPATAAEPAGIWLVQDGTAKVRVYACGEAMCGNVIWLSQPNDTETGQPQTDKLNADPQLRARAILGVQVVLGMQRMSEDNKWIGRIYNPDDGNTYNGSIELLNATQLKIQGCVAIHCQSEIWRRSN